MVAVTNTVTCSEVQSPCELNTDGLISFSRIRWRRIEYEREQTVLTGYTDGFDSPVGTEEERRSAQLWPGEWYDANPYMNYYFLGYHTGSDLLLPDSAAKGEPVYSIADGLVIYAGDAFTRDGSPSGFGTLVIIKHTPYLNPDGETIIAYSRYAHMKDISVTVGQEVKRGDQLGVIWNRGTQAHHLQLDISLTGILEEQPGYWPGNRKEDVETHFVDPLVFIQQHRPPDVTP